MHGHPKYPVHQPNVCVVARGNKSLGCCCYVCWFGLGGGGFWVVVVVAFCGGVLWFFVLLLLLLVFCLFWGGWDVFYFLGEWGELVTWNR